MLRAVRQYLMGRSGKALAFAAIALMVSGVSQIAMASAQVGQKAPDFKTNDLEGKPHQLSDYSGKYIVLEWHNEGCPYVRKHYNTGNMQRLQKVLTDDGVIWLSVISSAEGEQGYLTSGEAKKYMEEKKAVQTAVLLDPEGTMGKAYGAKVTPHMYLIGPDGKVLYNGAIDDKPTTDYADVQEAKNYLLVAYQQAKSGKEVQTPATRPYGCSVKYKN